ncbi:hypothetical protein IPN35_05870 [Candidatus Peregrinibacteria bacterium]|nr:MAG: hypothetical protein IPN35_05870 [Candidatus Peregrinibacteria bacterium]
MKYKIPLFLLAILLFPANTFAENIHVTTNIRNGQWFPSSFLLQFFTDREDAKIFWTRFPKRSPAEGNMYQSAISIIRSGSIHYFAFTPEPEITATDTKKITFFVESKTGYEHLRMTLVDPRHNMVVLKNFSAFPVQTDGWKITSQNGEFDFSGRELAPGKKMALSLPMNKTSPKIFLVAPDGKAKQLVAPPALLSGQYWECTTRRSSSCAIQEK